MTSCDIPNNLQHIMQRMQKACTQAGRSPEDVQLLAVSKTFPAEAVLAAHQCGQQCFGENYIQEGIAKIAALKEMGANNLEWHCIGPIQSNKTRSVAQHFDWVHTVDRLKTAERLAEQRPATLQPLNVLIQINPDGGENKSGIAPEQALELALAISKLPQLHLRGLMAIPEPQTDYAGQLAVFKQVRSIFDAVKQGLQKNHSLQATSFDTLSMGMTDDLEAAIAAGTTMIRVGSGIFGKRTPHLATLG